jgi:hypothetical protein
MWTAEKLCNITEWNSRSARFASVKCVFQLQEVNEDSLLFSTHS